MSVLDPKKTYKNLKNKGFKDTLTKSNDHNCKDLGDYLIKQMSFQCCLDKNDFIDLANCPLSKEDYLDILGKKGLLK